MSLGMKLLITLGVALVLILPTFTPMVSALDLPSSVTILELTCGLEFASGSANTLDYGSITPDEISTASGTVSVMNTGNTDGELLISGTDWKDDTDSTQMLVGVTHYGNAGAPYDSTSVLTSTAATLSFLPPSGSVSAQTFMVKGVLENPGFSGALTQTVIFSAEC
jgi:hypothetical protein